MPFAILSVVIQVGLAVHAVKTGKDTIWLYVILFVPVAGSLIYFITQVLPELSSHHGVRKARKTLISAVDPRRELRKRMEHLQISNTVENRIQLADECIEAGIYDEAIPLYTSCLTGMHQSDPNIMVKMAGAYFHNGNYEKARQILDELIKENPDYKSADGHLLYARTLESSGYLDDAAHEYEILNDYYPGEEARVRFGMMLENMGDRRRARDLFKETLLRARHSPRHYQKKERQWIKIAEKKAN